MEGWNCFTGDIFSPQMLNKGKPQHPSLWGWKCITERSLSEWNIKHKPPRGVVCKAIAHLRGVSHLPMPPAGLRIQTYHWSMLYEGHADFMPLAPSTLLLMTPMTSVSLLCTWHFRRSLTHCSEGASNSLALPWWLSNRRKEHWDLPTLLGRALLTACMKPH